jgi:hypothetical protein
MNKVNQIVAKLYDRGLLLLVELSLKLLGYKSPKIRVIKGGSIERGE